MNRTRRKTLKMLKRTYGRATHPDWQRREGPPVSDETLRESMRAIYNRCSEGDGIPETAIVSGALVNHALETTEYDPDRAYMIHDGQITPLD